MIIGQKFLFFVAFIGSLVIADADIQVDFPENVNARLDCYRLKYCRRSSGCMNFQTFLDIHVSRIVSGWPAELGQWAHQLNLRMSNAAGQVSGCGGSVVHPEWALTAAHCTAARVFIIVRAGLVNITKPEYMFETNVWYNHPSYNDDLPAVVQQHDIALLKFGRRLTFSDNLQPIRIQRSFDMNKEYTGQQAIASGYGLTWTGGSSPELLNWVYLRGVSNAQCFSLYGSLIDDSTVCATYYNVTSQSTCQGDSGGPLSILGEDNKLTLIGVTSFVSGRGCHTEDPAGFIRPGHYHPWYAQVTGIDFDVDSPTWSEEESSSESESSETDDTNEGGNNSSEEGNDSNEDDNSSDESYDDNNGSSGADNNSEENGEEPNHSDSESNEIDNDSNDTGLDSSDIKDILNDNDIKSQIGALFIAKLGGQINIENVNFYVGKHSKPNVKSL